MIGRIAFVALVATSSLTVPVTSAQAFFHRGCCGRPTTAFFAPVATVAPACCPQPRVVNYMPQTCYRTVYVNQPVVAYQPQTACDPCGRATTVMRPVTTFVTRARLVPYTTYRPVATTVARPCCARVPTTTFAPVAAPARPCCSPVSARTVMPAPSAAPYSPPPVASPVPTRVPSTPGATLQSPTPMPSLDAVPPSSDEERTFETSPLDANPPQSRVLMPPSNPDLSNLPRSLDPEDPDRTTAIPLRKKLAVRQASLVEPAKAETRSNVGSGWRPASQ